MVKHNSHLCSQYHVTFEVVIHTFHFFTGIQEAKKVTINPTIIVVKITDHEIPNVSGSESTSAR